MKTKCILASVVALGLTSSAMSDETFEDDVIITQNLCVGEECTKDMAFDFTSGDVRIQAPQVRLSFKDTTSGEDDWAIETGLDDANGFNISNTSRGNTVVNIHEGTPENTLVLRGNGWVGIGTALPDTDFHIVDSGPAASLRLESTFGSGGAFDFNVNQDALGIRETGTGNTAFVIDTGVPNFAMKVDSAGNLGLGTQSPEAPLDIRRSNGTAKVLVRNIGGSGAADMFEMRNNGGSYFSMNNVSSGRTWFFTHENAAQGRFIIGASGNGPDSMYYSPNGNMTIGGTLTENSDKHAKMAIEPVDAAAILDKVAQLPVSEWTYKDDDPSIRHIGPMAQDFHAAFGLGESETGIATLDSSGVALASIKALNDALKTATSDLEQAHSHIAQQDARLDAQGQLISELVARLEALEGS